MAVAAQIGCDEGEVRCRRRRIEIVDEQAEVHDVRVAPSLVIDHGMEVDKRNVPCRVLVRRGCALPFVLRVDGRVATRRRSARRVGHVLAIHAPCLSGGFELVRDRRDRRRVHAALSDGLAVRRHQDARQKIEEDFAV